MQRYKRNDSVDYHMLMNNLNVANDPTVIEKEQLSVLAKIDQTMRHDRHHNGSKSTPYQSDSE